ncbi:MAG: patatin-like phospholipase family protein [Firmicutes bacterium]|nr:patatin-like phospholipase family protein [Bacillota bacterium]
MKPFALALSGGGLLGAAHLGALKFLESQHVRASAIAGTSAGGLVASLYALQVPIDRLIAVGAMVAQHPRDYFHLNAEGLLHEVFPTLGAPATGLLIPDQFIQALLALAPGATTTDDWRIPTVLTSVDVISLRAVAFVNHDLRKPTRGSWQFLRHQPLALAMKATMALPGLFAAPHTKDAIYIDGGTADTLPIDWAYTLYPSRVVAIDVATPPRVSVERVGLIDIVSRAEAYATATLSRLRSGPDPAVTVRPDTAGVPFFGFEDYHRLVDAGWAAMEAAWPQIAGDD